MFPVSQSKLSTLQVLCPNMKKEDRETLVAVATAGLVNWQENDSENTHTHTHKCIDGLRWQIIIFGCVFADVYGCLAVLVCCLKANTDVEEEVVQAILATVMEWRNSKEDWFLFSR